MQSRVHVLKTRANEVFRPGGKVFYGWWMVCAAAGVQWLAAVLWMQCYGAYVVLLQDEFDWSKAVLAGAFALTRVESGILGPFQGWLVDRFGPRIILTIGTVIFGFGFILFSFTDSILSFYLTFALIALGSSLGGFATLTIAVVNWFDRHRAKALALSHIGYSIGGLSIPLTIFALESIGWRATALYSGIIVLALGLPLVQIFRQRPDMYSERPDGIPRQSAHKKSETAETVYKPRKSFTWRQAVRTPAFWFISAGHGLALLTVSAMMVHLIPHLTESLGFTLAGAGTIVALMTGCQLGGQFLGGYLGDRFDKRLICMACMLGHCTGLLMLTYASSLWMVIAFAILHGLGWGTRGPLMAALRADYFGTASFGTIMGISSLIVMFGMMGGALISGFLADHFGNYDIAFTTIAAAALIGCFCFWAAKPPDIDTVDTGVKT